jgi:catechol 2,3-dioxygenase-like lactoylglutathione lyase family enzyme
MIKYAILLSTLVLAAAFVQKKDDGKPADKPAAPPTPVPAKVSGFQYEGSTIMALSVKDMAAAQSWYTKVLGAQKFYELPDKTWCEMTSPVANALIGLSKTDDAKGSGGATLSFGVKDMAKAKAWLVENKVTIDGDVVEIPETVKLLNFKDPDGNKLLFYEPFMGK